MKSLGHRPDVWRLGHRPALDGVRGLAIAMVVIAHATFPLVPGGGLTGVHLFFVLSGFLITSLLIDEHGRTGDIDIGAFYGRRARRLLPALIITVVVVGAIDAVASASSAPAKVAQPLIALTYFANWARIGHIGLGPFGQTWSLAIEEQFYLIWPVLLIGLLPRLSRRVLLIVTAAGATLACGERAFLWEHGASYTRVYYGTDVVAASLLMGAAAAMLAAWYPIGGRIVRRALAPLGLAVLVAATLIVNQHNHSGQNWLATYGWTLIAFAATMLVYGAARFDALSWLSWRPLVWLGEISYALYLYHFALLWAMGPSGGSLLKVFVGIPVSVALAWASTRFVESRFRRRSAGDQRGRREQPALVAGVAQVGP